MPALRNQLNATALLTAVLIALGLAPNAEATVLVSSEGFESPPFAQAPLEGQAGWLVTGAGGSSAVVQSGVARSGQQAVRMERTANSDRFWARPISSAPDGRFVVIDWEMMIPQLNASSPGFGPFMGVAAFDDSDGFSVAVATLGVDVTTGDLLFQQQDTGFLLEASADVVVGQWMSYRIELDFAADTYSAFVDDALVATTGFVDRGFGIDRVTDVDLAVFSAAGDGVSAGLEGVAYIDNFIVRDGLRADFSGNGVVDAADYTLWRDNQGQDGFFLTGDGNADATVDQDDYGLWAAAFGETNDLPLISAAVPEPTAAAGVAIAVLLSVTAPARRG